MHIKRKKCENKCFFTCQGVFVNKKIFIFCYNTWSQGDCNEHLNNVNLFCDFSACVGLSMVRLAISSKPSTVQIIFTDIHFGLVWPLLKF